MVPVAVGYIEFIGLRIDKDLGRLSEVFQVVAAFALTGLTDLHQKFAVLSEFEYRVILRAGAALRCPVVAANPYVALVIDGDPMVRNRPIEALPWTTPIPEKTTLLIELENRRRRYAAFGRRRAGRRVHLARLERARPVNNPNMVFRIGRYADRCTQNPVVWQRPRPSQVHFKFRRHERGGVHLG